MLWEATVHTGLKFYFCDIAGDESRTHADCRTSNNEWEKEERRQKTERATIWATLRSYFDSRVGNNIRTLFFANNRRFLARGQGKTCSTAKNSKRPFQPDSGCEINAACFSYVMNTYLWVSKRFIAIRRS